MSDVLLKTLARRFDLPYEVLADAWAASAVGEPPDVPSDFQFFWTQENLEPPPENENPTVRAGWAGTYWWGRFMHLLAPPLSPLPQDIQEATAAFFYEASASFLPPPPLWASRLRIFLNARGEPAAGGYIVRAAEGEYYAVWGPQNPPDANLTVTKHSTKIAAASAVMRFLAEMTARFPTLTPGGTIPWKEAFLPMPETCSVCGSPLGPSALCYLCAGITTPEPGEEYLRLHQEAYDRIADALLPEGLAPQTVEKFWREGHRTDVSVRRYGTARTKALLLLSRLHLPSTILEALLPGEIVACMRLHLLLDVGLTRLETLERSTYQALVAVEHHHALQLARRHDRLATRFSSPLRLQPLAHLAERRSSLGRPLSYLVTARSGARGACGLLRERLTRGDPDTRLAAAKALTWAATLSDQARPFWEETLSHTDELVRLASVQAQLVIAKAGKECVPEDVLQRTASDDAVPAVRLAAQETLAVIFRVFPCPVCGEAVRENMEHACLTDYAAPPEVLDRCASSLLGIRRCPLAEAVARAMGKGNLSIPQAANILLDDSSPTSDRLRALNALDPRGGKRPAPDLEEGTSLRLLLRHPQAYYAALAALHLLQKTARSVGPEDEEGILAVAATLAAQGHLHAAVPLLYPPSAAPLWDSPLRLVQTCPACRTPLAAEPHACPLGREEQLLRLGDIEALLLEDRFTRHPPAASLLLGQYNALADSLHIPPHPLCPVAPPPPHHPELKKLLEGDAQAVHTAVHTLLASADSADAVMLAASLLPWANEGLRREVLQVLYEKRLEFCPRCGRFYPRSWNHRHPEELIPGSWAQMSLLPQALGPLEEQHIGRILTCLVQHDPDLGRPGVVFSRVHSLPADATGLPPVAAIAQTPDGRFFAIFGPEQGNLVVEEHPDRFAAYMAARNFLRRKVAKEI